jgi:hypothetical protein
MKFNFNTNNFTYVLSKYYVFILRMDTGPTSDIMTSDDSKTKKITCNTVTFYNAHSFLSLVNTFSIAWITQLQMGR